MEQLKNLEVEKAVLGAIIIDNSKLYDILAIGLKAECFYSTQHKVIFAELVKMGIEEKTPIDFVLLGDRLKKNEIFKGCLVSFLIELGCSVPVPSSGVYYAKIVLEKHILRQTYISLVQCITFVKNKDGDADITEGIKKRLVDILLLQERKKEDYKSLKAIMPGALNEFEGYFIEGDGGDCFSTGYGDLDKYIGGWYKEMIVLAGRTSLGKTTLALNMVYKLLKRGIPIGLFSFETTKNTIYLKLACIETKISFSRIRTKKISIEERTKLKDAIKNIKDLPLWIEDGAGLSVIDVVAKAKQMRAKEGVRFVVIDYLQLLKAVDSATSRVQQVSYDIKTLKDLSKDLQIPVLVISSLSRNYNDKSEPTLQELKESGDIEYTSDIVLLLHRLKKDKKEIERDETLLIVAKQRHGRLGKLSLVYLETGDRYEEVAGW